MSSVIEIPVDNLNELPGLSKLLVDFAGEARHFLLYGPMGAGKTTFIKELCLVLGSSDNFGSPTYSIVNEYKAGSGKIYHFDLFRLKTAEELMDIGIEEYLSSGNYCFFEWPEKVESLVDKGHLRIDIEPDGNNRYIRITKF